MPLDELALMRQLGQIEQGLLNVQNEVREFKQIVDDRFKSHAERWGKELDAMRINVGNVDGRLNQHIEIARHNGNGNGWKQKVAIGGGGAGGAIAVWEFMKFLVQGGVE